jgi:hypothetical protein
MDAGYWILDAGYWMLDTRCWILDAGYSMLDTGCWILDADNKYLLFSNHLCDSPWSSVNHQLKGHREPQRIGEPQSYFHIIQLLSAVLCVFSVALCGLPGC